MTRPEQVYGDCRASLALPAHIEDFDDWWRLQLDEVEPPNIGRGGWSRVETLTLASGERLFVKRQLNHCSRTLRHPLRGEPTLAREYAGLRALAELNIGVPEAVYFGTRILPDGIAAVLVTRELVDCVSLEDFEATITTMPQARRQLLLRELADIIGKLHRGGYQHRNLYPKHVFVKPLDAGFELYLIDLETMRRHWGIRRYWLRDIEVLHRRSPQWRNTERLYFLLHYLGLKRLDARAKTIARALVSRTRHKYGQG